MTSRFLLSCLLLFVLIGAISGCGSDIGGGGVAAKPTQASIVLSSTVTSGNQIGSVDFIIELPAGVTVPADTTGQIPLSNLYFSGQGSTFASTASFAFILGKYTPATSTAKAKVTVVVNTLAIDGASFSGMNQGTFATLLCDIAPDATVAATDFTAPTDILISSPKADLLYDSTSTAAQSASLSYAVTLY